MSDWVWWFVLGFLLLIVELTTGTFYVLMLALAMAAGGLAALAGASIAVQTMVAALVGATAIVLLRRRRWGRPERRRDPSTDPSQTFDIGQLVQVREWREGIARVQYRGAQWDAALVPGEPESPGPFYIHEVRGTRLTVSTRKP